jgi:hypothetical protein
MERCYPHPLHSALRSPAAGRAGRARGLERSLGGSKSTDHNAARPKWAELPIRRMNGRPCSSNLEQKMTSQSINQSIKSNQIKSINQSINQPGNTINLVSPPSSPPYFLEIEA